MEWLREIRESRRAKEIKMLLRRIKENEVTALAAQSTYYLILSFFPFLIFLVTVISYTPLLDEEVILQLRPFMPEEAFEMVLSNVEDMLNARRGTLMSTGMITTLFIASNGVAAMIKGVNKAYRSAENRPFWKIRSLAVLFTIALSLLIVISLMTLVFGEVIGNYVFEWIGISEFFKDVWQVSRTALTLVVMVFVFSSFYKFSPNVTIKIKETLPGAVFTTVCWVLFSFGFAYYVNHFGRYTVTYGSIGAIIILLTWLYLSSIVALIGAEINGWYHETKF
ncbi:YihY/virulence factor BrkB family protein [Tindallia californiensis]|uniref:Membrane protein n=1 Tax=Tindallia californiensis TaxID=159292 RepID=A0A1H3MNJ1_9FIRM|nr:YihY/virulence factor BrkB family protein [Tindallia californiensis]SDY78271.1 membrane protein [Tindallia californiensis]